MKTKSIKYRWLETRLPNESIRRLALITGARQTGKTTLSRIKYPDLNYINLDDPAVREKVHNISAQGWGNSLGNSILDEAQKEPAIFEKVKFAYDAGKIVFSLLLGSSQILLLKKVRESLAGRIFVFELWPLMLSELAAESSRPQYPLIDKIVSQNLPLDHYLKDLPEILMGEAEEKKAQAWNHVSQWGGMPELLFLHDQDKAEWLRSFEYTYLERDLQDLARIDDLEPFKTFQRILALRSGQMLSFSELARDSQVSVSTARRYFEYLRLSYQAILLKPFYKNLTSTVVKTPKLYWTDIGLLRQLSGYWGAVNGAFFETLIVSEMYKWINTLGRRAEIYYYRTRSGLEVDLILKTGQGYVGIEIKSRKKVDEHDAKALKQIAGVFGREWLGGMVIYSGDVMEKICNPGIWAMPALRLFC